MNFVFTVTRTRQHKDGIHTDSESSVILSTNDLLTPENTLTLAWIKTNFVYGMECKNCNCVFGKTKGTCQNIWVWYKTKLPAVLLNVTCQGIFPQNVIYFLIPVQRGTKRKKRIMFCYNHVIAFQWFLDSCELRQ